MNAGTQLDRNRSLRRLLVATAEDAGAHRLRWWRPRARVLIAMFASFVLAGAGAGALTAGALVRPATSQAVSQLESTMRIYAVGQVESGHVVGSSKFFIGTGTAELDLGQKPQGYPVLAISFWCLGSGTSSLKLYGKAIKLEVTDNVDQTSCSAPAEAPQPETLVPGAPGTPAVSSARPTISVVGSGKFAVWAAWVSQPHTAGDSIQQKTEIADGKVTRQEYLSAWSRLEGCMTQAGYTLGEVPQNELVFAYGYVSQAQTVFNFTCYPREFEDVDVLWQGEVETKGTACLTAHGARLPKDGDEMQAALEAAKLTPHECGID